MQQIKWIVSCIQQARKTTKNEKILSKFFPFYISVKVSEMQEIAQNLSIKFGALTDGMTRDFWYNSLAFTITNVHRDQRQSKR
jgi:hypothetical protein